MARRRLTVVLPCLNEERTVAGCVTEARQGVEALDHEAEILVVDNGSTDGSAGAARAVGARVVPERRRGYGSALGRGIREATGDFVVLGDADGSYRFDDLGPLIRALEEGADLVVGSRLRGRVEPGAMPWLHRYLGTPILTRLVNLFFRTRISDVNCGQRALRTEAARALDLRAAGMEFASEMVIKAALAGLKIVEVPVAFRRDRRDRPSHLRTWRDGWRHLRFILLFAPNIILVAPGLAALACGAFLGGPAFLGHASFGGAAAIVGAALVLIGAQLVQVGILVKTWYHVEGFYPRPYLDVLFRYVGFEVGLLLGLGLIAVDLVLGVPLLLAWRGGVAIDPSLIAASLMFLVLGMQVISSAVILSVLGIRKRGE
ncbi:MAG: glycosyltransferase family 2 protein [Planctomycetota bacterium]|jgi:glycosyltransferase involved in cell wall biosynthesis